MAAHSTEVSVPPLPAHGRTAAKAAFLALVTLALTVLTLALPRDAGYISPVWPVNAVALVMLLRSRPQAWPACLAAFVIAIAIGNMLLGTHLRGAVGLGLFNAAEVMICVVVLSRRGQSLDLSRSGDLAYFALVAGLLAPVVSGLAGATWIHLALERGFLSSFVIWAAGHSLGLMILAPALMAVLDARADLAEQPLTPSAVVAWVGLCAVTAGVFFQARYPIIFLVLPALLFLTVQMERLGAVAGVLTVAAISAVLSYCGMGPMNLIRTGWTSQILVLQAFLAVCIGISLPVAALHKQWRQTRQSLTAAVAEAREQSRRASMAEEVAGVGHWRLDNAGEQMSWSPAIAEIFGLAKGQLPSLAEAMAMVHPDQQAANALRIRRALDGEAVRDAVTRLVRPDGDVRYVFGRTLSERGPDGAVTSVFGTMVDITAQKRAEIAICESEARFRRLADNATDIIATYRVDGTFLYLSPSIFHVLGYRPDELVGEPTSRIIHPQDLPGVLGQFRAYIAAGPDAPPPRIQYRAVAKGGQVLCLEAHPRAIYGPDGRVAELHDVVRDVTAREEIRAEVETARQAAEEAVKVKSEFLANMSHELRTPLTSILGFTRLAAEQPDLVGDARTYVLRVADASSALLSTVNDILDFSKVEAGQVVVRPEPFAPAALARSTLDLFLPQAAAKDIDLILDSDLAADAAVLADPDRVRQVLLNLVSNAVKFTAAGSVTVRLRLLDETLRVEVVDTGEGIAPEACGRLFRRFSQVDGSSTRAHSGAGLGLAICKGLVEAMGGAIGLDSGAGAGSRFWFCIPAPPAASLVGPAAAAEGLPGAGAGLRGARVLVADDHPANRELARLFLGAMGMQVTEAADGPGAVAMAMDWPFDLILMDMRMPGMTGAEAAEAIRAGGPNDTTPILAFTANAGDNDEAFFRRGGFDGVVAKPLDASALILAVAKALAFDGCPASGGQRHAG